MDFKPGDNVRLKSSMERMTVEAVEGEKVHCLYLYTGSVRRWAFNPVVLVPAPEDPRREILEWLKEVGPIDG